MPALDGRLRGPVEKTILDARAAAEEAARVALDTLAVNRDAPFATMDAPVRDLRNALRARARVLGGGALAGGLSPLIQEVAYEQWHRMLFARFLAENDLLMHPAGLPVTLEECAELAAEEGESDAWGVAAKYAAAMLPGIFRNDDPAAQVRLAPEGRASLERQLGELPRPLFAADDGLGWVYQFWQKDKKDEINASERKIEGVDIGPVTQLFTENYMVRFLLENSLGAWWAARHPDSPLVKGFDYLRLDEEGRPAAGSFAGWPGRAAEVTMMDPCCGSGHFLVEAFSMLWQMRAEEEGLSPTEAQDAVLRDNLFGVELDQRCVQIAAFAVALSAWKAGGYRELPQPAIACSGAPVSGQLREWKELASGDRTVEEGLEALHAQFRDAPNLGSLIDPRNPTAEGRLFSVDYSVVAPALDELLSRERDPQAQVVGVTAAGVARAAALLSREFTLVMTNVPYLGVQRMPEAMAAFLLDRYPNSANDLATVFIERCLRLASQTAALVTPMGWLFLRYFRELRRALLSSASWRLFAPLGKGAFEAISGHVVQSALLVMSHGDSDGRVAAVDATKSTGATSKAAVLRDDPVLFLSQGDLRRSPDTLLALDAGRERPLADFATSWQGLVTSDVARFIVRFWEVPRVEEPWRKFLTAPSTTSLYAGRECLLRWESGRGDLVRNSGAHNFNPREALGKVGVLVGQGSLRVTLYCGEMFNDASSPVIPFDQGNVAALWAYMSSPEYAERVRRINHKVIVGSGYLVKVPFDVRYWQDVARQQYPDGLPEPRSDDPTQWLFSGSPVGCDSPLQVAIARLLGYRWPDQRADSLDRCADADGLVCLPAVAGEPPAAESLRALLTSAYGSAWSAATQEAILAAAGYPGKSLEAWLRDGFFEQHCRLFQSRPFLWQIWDGRPDGFSAIVNYHRLDGALLDKLTYTYLGGWIGQQRAAAERGEAAAEGRLAAALELQRKLTLIREGEPPYDIYVRWKPLHRQPMGWEPDLDDGVRLNVRPFVEAGILRRRFTIHWNKDKGGGDVERINDRHLSLEEKRRARAAAGVLA